MAYLLFVHWNSLKEIGPKIFGLYRWKFISRNYPFKKIIIHFMLLMYNLTYLAGILQVFANHFYVKASRTKLYKIILQKFQFYHILELLPPLSPQILDTSHTINKKTILMTKLRFFIE